MQGKKIQATSFSNEVDSFNEKLQIYHRYILSGGEVRTIDHVHRKVDNKYQLILDGCMKVQTVEDDEDSEIDIIYDLKTLQEAESINDSRKHFGNILKHLLFMINYFYATS